MANNVDNDYKKELKKLMRTLFEFDYADLDFGIYRIMNKKHSEIERFIEKDLIDAVNVELAQYSEFNQQTLKKEVEVIQAEIKEKLGNDALDANEKIKPVIITTPFAKQIADRYQAACEKLKEAELSNQHEAEIFTHIYQFFSRYYKDGDFISLRRYSQKEKYAIPYNGEEVLLHWANKDQYYIKTGENFKNYSFKIGEYTVGFLIKEAEGTVNNNKNENRFFVLAALDDNIVYDDSNKTLTVFFEYRGLSKDEEKAYATKNVQDAILTKIKTEILSQIKNSGLKAALDKVVNNETKRTMLEKHLGTYTKKNTTDYFIHKDLKGFLMQELDFYIKNEVFHLDDLGTENELGVEQYVIRAKVIKKISLRIIDFLAQIENFQKMLFEKKKFVISTDYCITLDYIDEKYYPEMLKNEKQIEEWKRLYSFDIDAEVNKLKRSLVGTAKDAAERKMELLKQNQTLVIDTKFYNLDYKNQVLSEIDNIDEKTTGILINSENFQALNLLLNKYKENIKCCYIDPPYNTNATEILYKNEYKNSSWLSLLADRLICAKQLLAKSGIICVTIDDYEFSNLNLIMQRIFLQNNYLATTVIRNNPSGRSTVKGFSVNHEYGLYYSADNAHAELGRLPHSETQTSRYDQTDKNGKRYEWENLRRNGPESNRVDRPKQFYPILFNKKENTIKLPEMSFDPKTKLWIIKEEIDETMWSKIWPLHPDGTEKVWRYSTENIENEPERFKVEYKNERYEVYRKKYLNVEGILPRTWWDNANYSARDTGTRNIVELFSEKDAFDFAKSVYAVRDSLTISNLNYGETCIDFFAGSGTTGHAVLKLNKEDGGERKFILVEMGEYFETVTKPRILKVIYSDNWKDGKPQDNNGSIKQIIKYQTLEQYEDTLNNIDFADSGSVQRTLMDMEGYFLRYMLDFETRDSSPCRFNVTKLNKPFSYTLKIARGNELKEEIVDLVETFNYLLGIHVKQIKTYDNKGAYYKVVVGKKDEEEIVIVWRDAEDLDLEADKKFIEEQILSKLKPSKTYINADFHVERALPIEPEFRKLMGV